MDSRHAAAGTGMAGWVCGSMAALALAAAVQGQTVLYVDDDAPAGGDGTSWNKAYRDLQIALDRCRGPNPPGGEIEIRIAEGVYTPDRGTLNRSKYYDVTLNPTTITSAVTITISLSLIGGFVGLKGPDHDLREPETHPTVLSADLKRNDLPTGGNHTDNAYRILIGELRDQDLLLDGLIFRGANLESGGFDTPAPIDIRSGDYPFDASAVAISGCRFEDNRNSGSGAGALWVYEAELVVERSRFVGNTSLGGAGAVSVQWNSNSSFIDCEFTRNHGTSGGAVQNSGSGFEVSRCVFAGNVAQFDGGAILSRDYGATYYNCKMAHNTAGRSGGAVAMTSQGSIDMRCCTVVGNGAAYGGAMFVNGYLYLSNSILVDNVATAHGSSLALDAIWTDPQIDHCLIEGGLDGFYGYWSSLVWDPSNLDADPVFRDPSGPDGDPSTWEDNDYRLAPASPCIDAGNDQSAGAFFADVAGAPRFYNIPGRGTSIVDIGAYEAQPSGCAADFNGDGFITGDDADSFMLVFLAGKPGADVDWNGFVNGDDYDLFAERFYNGC